MAEQGKKVEVRFGAFTCSIEGYDNPVEQMREILGMMQRMITETPALAEADPKFDASRLEDAIANEDPDNPTPGIVVIRNADSAVSQDPAPAADEDFVDEAETIAESTRVETAEVEPDAVADPILETVEDAEAAVSAPVDDPAETEAEAATFSISNAFDDPDEDNSVPDPSQSLDIETEVARATGPTTDLNYPDLAAAAFATVAGVNTDVLAEPEQDAALVADPVSPADLDQTTTLEDAVAVADEQDDTDPEAWSDDVPVPDADDVTGGEPSPAPMSAPAEPKQRLGERIRNIFAAPEAAPRRDPVNIFSSPATATAPAPRPAQVNIFASPGAAAASAVRHEVEELIEEPAPDAPVYDDPLRSPAPEAPAEEHDAPAAFDAPADDAPREHQRTRTGLAGKIRSIFAPPPGPSTPEAINLVLRPEPPVETAQSTVDPEPLADTVAPEPEPQFETQNTAPAADEDGQSRFQEMLSRVHGVSPVAAPGTAPEEVPVPQYNNQTEDATAQYLAEQASDPSVAGQLEAAAAWITLVQGKSRFSRRDVMNVLETIPTEESRALADRIKGFGKLVRSGSLVLVDDGVFALAQTGRDRFQAMLDQR